MWNVNIKGTIENAYKKCIKLPTKGKLNNYIINREIQNLKVTNNTLEFILEMTTYIDKYIILDGEVLDKKTFEYVRDATDEELQLFYNIRLNELKMKNLKNKISR